MCQWLIENNVNLDDKRAEGILTRFDQWGEDICQLLIERRICLSMTDDMLRLALGEPTTIDQEEVSERGEKFRWIYGVPRRGATYIWFRDGKVTKFKQRAVTCLLRASRPEPLALFVSAFAQNRLSERGGMLFCTRSRPGASDTAWPSVGTTATRTVEQNQ